MRTNAVIGAGMTGLVIALRLLQAGEGVAIYERARVPGGLAAGFEPMPGAAHLECFYHHVFRSDARFVALCGELGIGDRLVFSRPETACFIDGRTQRLDSARSLLRFTSLRKRDRVRLAFALAILKLAPRAEPFEPSLASAWLRAVAGDRAYDAIFEPLFRGKFGEHADAISLAWFWARIHDRTPELGTIRGGFDAFYRSLAARVAELGGRFNYGSDVTSIARAAGGGLAVTDGANEATTVRVDRVFATAPLDALARMCPELPPEFVRAHASSPMLGARCLILALDRPLTGIYWINVCEKGWPFLVVVEHTAFVRPEAYGGRHLVYIGNYARSFPDTEAKTLAREFTPYLRELNAAFDESWVTESWLFVARDAQPIVTPTYGATIAPAETPVPGLFVANLAQVYPHDRGQNYAIELAERVVARAGANV